MRETERERERERERKERERDRDRETERETERDRDRERERETHRERERKRERETERQREIPAQNEVQISPSPVQCLRQEATQYIDTTLICLEVLFVCFCFACMWQTRAGKIRKENKCSLQLYHKMNEKSDPSALCFGHETVPS